METNKQLVEAIVNAKHRPKVWISTSAVGELTTYKPLAQYWFCGLFLENNFVFMYSVGCVWYISFSY